MEPTPPKDVGESGGRSCPRCKKDVTGAANTCPHCGAWLGESGSGNRGCSGVAGVLLGVGTLLFLGGGAATFFTLLIYSNSGYGREKMAPILAVPQAIALAGAVIIVAGIAVGIIKRRK